ncbi:MAG: hypothetical protein U9N48_08695 [Euryarchaeota archaeon]|nr:hypothetical protein [Euryarchaeota archaeon]
MECIELSRDTRVWIYKDDESDEADSVIYDLLREMRARLREEAQAYAAYLEMKRFKTGVTVAVVDVTVSPLQEVETRLCPSEAVNNALFAAVAELGQRD